MTTFIAGQDAKFAVTVTRDGAAVPIASDSTVTAQIYDARGSAALAGPLALVANTPGASWPTGVVAGTFLAAAMSGVPAGPAMLVIRSTDPVIVKRLAVNVEADTPPVRSSLFVRDLVVDELRANQLVLLASTISPAVGQLSDDYLWSKILAAESELSHRLRVKFVPTAFFPLQPTQQQIDALNGMPWEIDPGYDYVPEMFQGDRWALTVTRQKPIQSVTSIRFAYPSPVAGVFDVPLDWIRINAKYGQINLVPGSSANVAPLNAFILMALGGGRTVPFMMQITYVAGLGNAAVDYPELLDAIKKKAILKAIEDTCPPQSGSISADGLSQSLSIDMDKYRDTVDMIIDGPKDTNGGLRAAIHGIRVGFMGQ